MKLYILEAADQRAPKLRQSVIVPVNNSYDRKSKRYENITHRLAVFVGASNC